MSRYFICENCDRASKHDYIGWTNTHTNVLTTSCGCIEYKFHDMFNYARYGDCDSLKKYLDVYPSHVNNVYGSNGKTLLHIAAYNSDLKIVKMLINDYRANPLCDTLDTKQTPYDIAISKIDFYEIKDKSCLISQFLYDSMIE